MAIFKTRWRSTSRTREAGEFRADSPVGTDAQLNVEDETWGLGRKPGAALRFNAGTRLGFTWKLAGGTSTSAQRPSSPTWTTRDHSSERGLLNSNIGRGNQVPQQLMGSVFHQVNPRWAVLGSVGGSNGRSSAQVEFGIDNTGSPTSLTKNLEFKDTWHSRRARNTT